MKKLTLLALTLGLTFGAFAQRTANSSELNANGKQLQKEISAFNFSKKTPVKELGVLLELTNFDGKDGDVSLTFGEGVEGWTLMLFNGTYGAEEAESVVEYMIKNAQKFYQPNPVSTQLSKLFEGLEEGEYSMWVLALNEAWWNQELSDEEFQEQADLGYSFVNFKIDGVGLVDASSIVTTVYPNPSSENIVVTATSNIEKVELVNTLGQVVYSANVNASSVNVPVANVAKGNYLVKVTTANRVATSKVIVK